MPSSKKVVKAEGIIKEVLPSLKFKVQLDNGKVILAHLAGKMRIHRIRITSGDRVCIEMSPYDLTKGRITYRL